jgi:hypothetical protein
MFDGEKQDLILDFIALSILPTGRSVVKQGFAIIETDGQPGSSRARA